jgi:hypothetical protein
MADSKTCQFCGGEIRFRMIRGVCVPLHDADTVCVTYGRSCQPDVCHKTQCPYCGQKVYFVRHNNGAVWFDELGKPWDKHPCFLDKPEPTNPAIAGTFNVRRIRRVLRFYKMVDGGLDSTHLCFEVHFGLAGRKPIVWYVIPESSPDFSSEKISKWGGRYCYVSDSLGELEFFNGEKFVLFRKDEI